jgi:Phosphate-starvation-inducible E family
MDSQLSHKGRPTRGVEFIQRVEEVVYLGIGGLLILTLLLAVAGAGKILWDGLEDWAGTSAIFQLIDRLLLVLMLVEILNTVQVSIKTGTLVCEPFLIVGLIACIRRILVITLETSQITQPGHWQAENIPLFQASMLELGVLGALVIILIGSIYVIRLPTRVVEQDAP